MQNSSVRNLIKTMAIGMTMMFALGCTDDAVSADDTESGYDSDVLSDSSSEKLSDSDSIDGGDADSDTATDFENSTDSGSDSGEALPVTCADWDWSCVTVDVAQPYGTNVVKVPAAQNWVNTGLYLKQGEQVSISATGSWNVLGDGSTGAEGHAGQPVGGQEGSTCLLGSLIGRMGLHYKDNQIHCDGATATITAEKDGIFYLGALASNDLGESYETRRFASGELEVTVTSTGNVVPMINAELAATYDFASVASGWVEVFGEHTILTLPVSTAITDSATILAAVERLDDFYKLHYELRGALPQHGQRIRYFPDETTAGYMLAGNPIRMKDVLVFGDDTTRISRAGEEGTGVWGFAHELGHVFSFVNGVWVYQISSIEIWVNIFSVHALEKLNLPMHENALKCETMQPFTSYTQYENSVWDALCFWLILQDNHGWELYQDFFLDLNTRTNGEVGNWGYIHDQMEIAAGEDITPLFNQWNMRTN